MQLRCRYRDGLPSSGWRASHVHSKTAGADRCKGIPNWLMGLGRPPPVLGPEGPCRCQPRGERERDVLYSASPSRYTVLFAVFPLRGGETSRKKSANVVGCCVCVCVCCGCVSSRITAGSLLTATCNFAFSRNADSLSIRRDPVVQIPESARNM